VAVWLVLFDDQYTAEIVLYNNCFEHALRGSWNAQISAA
jgi:hypothetical protein